jgi:hypothetical protein
MPVRKFRSIEEMNAAQTWLPAGDPAIGGTIRALWRLAQAPAAFQRPKGIRKFRSIEEKNAYDEYYENLRIAHIQAANAKK